MKRIALILLKLAVIGLIGAAIGYKLGLEPLRQFLESALSFILIISIIVFIHEGGHYLVAKWSGVKIDTFSLGFGNEVFGWNDKSGTRWRVSSLPLGGYVKMYGDATEASSPLEEIASLPPEEKAKTFYYKPLWKKACIVVAGPLSNFILTIAILTCFIFTRGLMSTEPVVGEVMKDTPAQAAGIKADDRILSINGEKVEFFTDISRMILTNLGTPVDIVLRRGNKDVALTLVPKQIKEKDSLGEESRPIIGITSKLITFRKCVSAPPGRVGKPRAPRMISCATTLRVVGQIIEGDRSAKVNTIKGPFGMAKLSGQAAIEKACRMMFLLMALISANLGLVKPLSHPDAFRRADTCCFTASRPQRAPRPANVFQEYGMRLGMALIVLHADGVCHPQ